MSSTNILGFDLRAAHFLGKTYCTLSVVIRWTYTTNYTIKTTG